MELWIGSLNLGLLYAFMAIGVFITSRIHNFPDVTVDGSFTTGAATAAVLIAAGVNPFISLIAAFAVGFIAGAITAYIHTRLKIDGLLAGIIVMTGLYSINLHIMGRSNIPLLNMPVFNSYIENFNPGLNTEVWLAIALIMISIVFWILISMFFKTDFGIRMRATGDNPIMSSAYSVNVNRVIVIGVALSNGLVGISGGLVAQYQGFADIGMGIGTLVIGFASVIIGESILRSRSIFAKIMSAIIGSIIFRMIIAFALYAGMDPIDLKLLTAAFVLTTLIISKTVSNKNKKKEEFSKYLQKFKLNRKIFYTLCTIILLVIAFLAYQKFSSQGDSKKVKIGVVQFIENGLLNITRDAFLKEMEKIGYKSGETCEIEVKNANGEMAILNSILDKFNVDQKDIIVAISTPSLQASLNKIKERPVVFATVANPFIVKAGTSDIDHVPNFTGVYGWVDMEQFLTLARNILPGKTRFGCIWDPSQTNTAFNIKKLREEIAKNPDITFIETTITNSSEVLQGTNALIDKKVDAFLLVPDNIIYSSFDVVVKATQEKKIPIFLSDPERLKDGALATFGYDYIISGIQAAHLVDRVLKGENPKNIPFEKYSKVTRGINLKVAKNLGIPITDEIIKKANHVIEADGSERFTTSLNSGSGKRAVVFYFNDNVLLKTTVDGILAELKSSGIIDEIGLKIDLKNAQGEYSLAQSIAQNIVEQNYDYIITASTPTLQIMANANKKIPHIFGAVTDPYRMGVAKTPEDHLPNVTGVATFQPVETTIRIMRETLPSAKRIGIVWNPAEACSEACTFKARDAAKKYNFELIEATVTSTGEVIDAVKSLLSKNLDVFFTSGDNTVNLTLNTIGSLLKERKVPYFTNNPPDIEIGSLISVGADYFEVGKETGKFAEKILRGENPKNVPIHNYVPEQIGVNLALAKSYGITIPENIINKAAKVKR